MTVQVMKRSEAPSWALHTSSFKNDERCIEVDVVIGEHYAQVLGQTQRLFQDSKTLVDYDLRFSTEGDAWVGITCEDV
jgi:hypothetical protein